MMATEPTGAERRKYARFNDRFLLRVEVQLLPVPPLFGDVMEGRVLDLSAGGMALLLPEMLPKGAGLKMTLRFPGKFHFEALVRVCYTRKQKTDTGFLHGIAFANLPLETAKRIEIMAQYTRSCDHRIRNNAPRICYPACALMNVCTRPQRDAQAAEPVAMQLEPCESGPVTCEEAGAPEPEQAPAAVNREPAAPQPNDPPLSPPPPETEAAPLNAGPMEPVQTAPDGAAEAATPNATPPPPNASAPNEDLPEDLISSWTSFKSAFLKRLT